MVRYIIRATSKTSGKEGFIGFNMALYERIECAMMLNYGQALIAMQRASEHWLNCHIEELNFVVE